MRSWKGYLSFLLVFAAVFGVCTLPIERQRSRDKTAVPTETQPMFTVVIDAGHGGEDGGAVSANGVLEKDLNLSVAIYLEQYLQASGIPTVMTRSTDELLYDKNGDFRGKKKSQDLANRRQIAENTENAVFVSIHMNSFPQESSRGLQVWYSPHRQESETLAKIVQRLAKEQIQPENRREAKKAGSGIYLLNKLECPAILVECGFLSNPAEADLLSDENYRQKTAFLIYLSLLQYRETVQNQN